MLSDQTATNVSPVTSRNIEGRDEVADAWIDPHYRSWRHISWRAWLCPNGEYHQPGQVNPDNAPMTGMAACVNCAAWLLPHWPTWERCGGDPGACTVVLPCQHHAGISG